jgi:pyruvate/2-oxoglutarate dehydrogenase complex dihydrolipoamide acyltransferase (E2) component
MPRVPRGTPDEGEAVDEPDRMEGAPAPMEGPVPPGVAIPDDEADDASVADLRAEATRRGVMPETGSGSGGRIVRADLEAALEHAPPDPPAGRPPLATVAESVAIVPPPESERE